MLGRLGESGGLLVGRNREAGFTLFEVLVALVVLSVTVVAVLQLFGGGLRLVRASRDQVAAALLASAKLSELAIEPGAELEEGTTEGNEGQYRWTRRVTLEPERLVVESTPLPVEPTARGSGSGGQTTATRRDVTVRLARVSVEVRWGNNRHIELMTLRAWAVKP